MSNKSLLTTSAAVVFLLIINLGTCHEQQDDYTFSKPISKSQMGLTNKSRAEKLSHFRFYFQEIISGQRPTSMEVVKMPITSSSPTGFGFIVVIDNALTLTPNRSSKIVGRAQGIYVSADMSEFGFMMSMNIVFTEGKFNGSSLSILGRNHVKDEVRELPVLGGSGAFRFARGYAEVRTQSFDLKSGDAVLEFNVYVLHH